MSTWQIKLKDRVLENFAVFEEEKLIVGRSRSADISIDNDSVSRHHVSLEMRHDRYMLTDLDSKNGTFVNGDQISGTVTVKPTDYIQIGKFQLAMVPSTESEALPWGMFRDQEKVPTEPEPEDIKETVFISSRWINLIKGQATPNKLKLKGKKKYDIGSDDTCDVQVPGWRAAKIKFSILMSGTEHYLMPDAEAKCPAVNGKKIKSKLKLESGDIIGIGGSKLRYG